MAKKATSEAPLRLVLSAVWEDRSIAFDLRKHLVSLERAGHLSIWSGSDIEAGDDLRTATKKSFEGADIILLIVSPDYVASEFVYDLELKIALERHEKGEALVIPVIVRPCIWQDTPFGNLQALPRSAKPVTEWLNRDEALADVARGVRTAIEGLSERRKGSPKTPKSQSQIAKKKSFEAEKVFVTTRPPDITFVEPADFKFMRSALRQEGKTIVVQGPSGIGKTSAVRKLLDAEKREYTYLSAKNEEDLPAIRQLAGSKGTVVIDDFHWLTNDEQKKVADFLKYAADDLKSTSKFLIIGIPNTGEKLIRFSFDLANRITTFSMGNVSDSAILEMIKKGEEALQVDFLNKSSIAAAAYGSLQVAQLLCLYICNINEVERTQKSRKSIQNGLTLAIDKIRTDLAPKYEDMVRAFALLGGKKDKTSISLLRELAFVEDGILHLLDLKSKRPELKLGIEKLLKQEEFVHFFETHLEFRKHILFDEQVPALIIDDPQFRFYLNNISMEQLIARTGKAADGGRYKVFISYSHTDEAWLKKVLIHLKHLERKAIIDLWVDKRIRAGQKWREEIQKALAETRVALLLISPDFLASDFIADNEIPLILKAAENEQAKVLQLILRPSSIQRFEELSQFQMVNDPKRPLAGLSEVEQDEVLVHLADLVDEYAGESD